MLLRVSISIGEVYLSYISINNFLAYFLHLTFQKKYFSLRLVLMEIQPYKSC